MSDDNEAQEFERERYNYSPAAGLGNDTAESERGEEPQEEQEDDDGEVGLSVAPANRGTFVDEETGKRFTRSNVTYVSKADAERLLERTRRGSPVFVRADS